MAASSVVRRLLEVERSQLGAHESPRNSNNVKYNTAFYGHPVHNVGSTNYAWCVVFQWWCMQKAGIPTSIFPKSANVFAVRDWFKKKHRFDHTPKVGSLVIFRFSHIGLVEKVLSGGRIQTIEGNTDDQGHRTGGKVMRKVRSREILGYCHPEYDKVVTKPVKPVPKPIPKPVPVPGPVGSTMAHVAVSTKDVLIPAEKYTRVTFSTGLGTGPGLFIADITIDAPALPDPATPDGAELRYRLIQADPAHDLVTSREHPETVMALSQTPTSDHAVTASHLRAGQQLWLEVFCTEAVTLPEISAEVVMLSSS